MKLLRGISNLIHFDRGVVATIGNFDGVHLGHQHLIQTLKAKANSLNLPVVVILFEPQPREYFKKEQAPARLATLREKVEMLQHCEVDYLYCIRFNERVAQTLPAEFATELLFKNLNVKYLLVGADFHFGKNRQGDVELLQMLGKEYGCEVEIFADYMLDKQKISSSKIREALDLGNFALAQRYLGRPYSISGRVLRGDGRGRQWGIPTANLCLKRLSLPLHGVFVIQAEIAGKCYYGVANLGNRPTVDGTKNVLEVHLFDFNQSIYGEQLRVSFLHKLRGEVKFTSVDNLIAQIHLDIEAAKRYLKDNSIN
ncbi:MAG: bifunctional riboflavin kinase/FAD synthetase [Legionella sp.]|nr:MAG: bifunctional riboflavin kinase/FAD synthetase [Legionella sp.]